MYKLIYNLQRVLQDQIKYTGVLINIFNWIALTNWTISHEHNFLLHINMAIEWYNRVIKAIPWCPADYTHDRELPVAWISILLMVCWKSPMWMENLRHFLENFHDHFQRSTEFQWYFHCSLTLWETKLLNTRCKLFFLRSIKYTQHKKLTRHCFFNNTSHKGSIRACSLSKVLNLCPAWNLSPRALLSVWFLR